MPTSTWHPSNLASPPTNVLRTFLSPSYILLEFHFTISITLSLYRQYKSRKSALSNACLSKIGALIILTVIIFAMLSYHMLSLFIASYISWSGRVEVLRRVFGIGCSNITE
ncbi:hypothetical protein K469DRAFT_709576 [Zopfia rhizophila CBS 207.26]|uniref:Uncharacterized protein n=1 Tax=Zopfia rhizophila CBS 207.26 TaxID=1314779 RepID=A0A6A6EPG5_9PEZI|nr:hypothetical protein K469DRAFT_709576 [Zopfia rhizophila CBS 207.26]